MPAAPYNQGGDPAWGNWKGTATQSSTSAATPWPSSAPAAASGTQAAIPWAAALTHVNTAAAGPQQAAVGVSSIVQGQTAAASVPAEATTVASENAAAAAAAAEPLTEWSKFGEHWIVEWQYDDGGWWHSYTRSFSDRLEQCLRTQSAKEIRFRPCGNVEFVYNLEELWQMNDETKGRRVIRRILIAEMEWTKVAERRAAVEQHNASQFTLEACHRRTGRKSRSQSASGSQSRSQSRR